MIPIPEPYQKQVGNELFKFSIIPVQGGLFTIAASVSKYVAPTDHLGSVLLNGAGSEGKWDPDHQFSEMSIKNMAGETRAVEFPYAEGMIMEIFQGIKNAKSCKNLGKVVLIDMKD